MFWFGNILTAMIAGGVITFAVVKRSVLGAMASGLALAGGCALALNVTVVPNALFFVREVIAARIENVMPVPLAWRATQIGIETSSILLNVCCLVCFATAIFVPRPARPPMGVPR